MSGILLAAFESGPVPIAALCTRFIGTLTKVEDCLLRHPAVAAAGVGPVEVADRIAQLVIQRVERAVFHEVEVLPGSSRGDGGHGSTGGHSGERTEGERTELVSQDGQS